MGEGSRTIDRSPLAGLEDLEMEPVVSSINGMARLPGAGEPEKHLALHVTARDSQKNSAG